MSTRGPTTVRGNDWRKVDVPRLEEFVPILPVTVVIPHYEAPGALALTLAALERQSYPRDLFEVIVVDDGSGVPLSQPVGTPLDVKVIHQERRGFGAPRARNRGARAAAHDIVVFLDCDMMPEAGWLAAHARWHHVLSDALTLGFRAHVRTGDIDPSSIRERPGSLGDLFSNRPAERPEWIEFHMARTNELTSTADDIFRVVTSGNLGVGKAFLESVGGFDESFTQWGAEDTEFGYRAYTRGALLVPEREAFCWHQGAGATPSDEEILSLDLQQAKIAHLIAQYRFRRASPGRSFTVPQFVVSVETRDAPVEQVFSVVERILGDRIHDLVVRIEDRPGDEGFGLIRRHFGPDPRVRFGSPDTALDSFPNAAFHITVPAGAEPAENFVYTMRTELGGAVEATLILGDDAQVSIVRTWALHRMRRNGRSIGELGARVSVKVRRMVLVSARPQGWAGLKALVRRVRSQLRRMYWTVRRIRARVVGLVRRMYWTVRRIRARVVGLVRAILRIRNPRQAWQFLKWLAGAVHSRLQVWLPFVFRPSTDALPVSDYPLGAEIVTSGRRARAVLGASRRVFSTVDGHHVDLILADDPDAVEQALDPDVPVVFLTEQARRLSVPALDPRSTNPIGWIRDAEPTVGVLGALELLPPGVTADAVLSADDRDPLLRTWYVVDVAGFHPDPVSRASTLAALAAKGVVVRLADSDPGLERLLGHDLYGLMSGDGLLHADPGERELMSIAARREALRSHSLASRAREIISAAALNAPTLPEVSVLAVATDPDLLPGLLEAVCSQTYPRLEMVLLLQGGVFGDEVEETAAEAPCRTRVLRMEDSQTLGTALNRGVVASGGALLTRMDDRSLYASEHVWDLVLAREYSGAELVAKGAEFLYLAHIDRMVHLHVGGGEEFPAARDALADGAMLISRHDLAAAGGWRRLRTDAGSALADDVTSIGGSVYRTHGCGYVQVVDGSPEERRQEDAYILDQAGEVWDGWRPERAGLAGTVSPFTGGRSAGRAGTPSPRPATVRGPQPTKVRGNDWHRVDVPSLEDFVPTLPVTVVVPYYEAPEALELTLAALERQRYPRDLFEVVVVDDGSRVPLQQPTYTDLNVQVVHQEDRGFGLARARNTGAGAASHGILIFLDCDMMPEAGWLAAHARWHHVVTDALTLGFRAHVEVDGVDIAMVRNLTGSLEDMFSDRPSARPEWIEFHMDRTDDLTSSADDLFRVVTGGNLGVSREFFETVGGFDESFTQWGAEDTEFGYRAYTHGALLVPVREGFCWHQGVGAAPSEAERRSLQLQRAKIAHLIAHYGFRGAPAGRTFTVPQYVVTVEAGYAPVDRLFHVAERILGDRVHDLVVMIEDRPEDDAFEWFRRQLGPDPRVRFGPVHTVLDEFPISSFHVTIPPGADVGVNIIHTLRNKLGSAVHATMTLSDGSRVSIVRTWALHRANRAGKSIADLGAAVSAEAVRTAPGAPTVLRSRPFARRVRRLSSKAGRLLEEFRRIDSFGQAWLFAKWLAGAVGWRLRGVRRRYRRSRTRPKGIGAGADRLLETAQMAPFGGVGAGYPLGAEIVTVGPQAVAVFGNSIRVGHSLDGRHVDLVVADTRDAAGEVEVPLVILSELPVRFSVPAFDPLTINPIGWHREPEKGVGALGPLDLLPSGSAANHTVACNDREALRVVHHLEDVAAFHSDMTTRAATLAAVAGMGVVVHLADDDPALESRLGAELYALISAPDILEADLHGRELLSTSMRRAALRDHTLRARAREVIGAGLPDPPVLPDVSVLAVTKRPDLVADLLVTVASQTYPRLELILVLHGEGFGNDVEAAAADLPILTRVLRVDGRHRFGAALNRAVSASGGTLLTKMDDDDVYSDEHIWDLVLAHEYSGAQLVAKGSEFVYLARSDKTIHRFCGKGEAASKVISIAGGTLLISRYDLETAGGWRRVPRGVDVALVEDVRRVGGKVYRTHGFGYVLVRHGSGHTWENDDTYFLRHAEQIRAGWTPEFAGLAPGVLLPGPATSSSAG